jgi:DNA-binding MarR family transcriptional regulator
VTSAKEIINELLVEVFNHILDIEGENLRKHGVKLSMTEVHVLEAIKNVEVATMGNVAQKLRVTLGTLTTSINVLVRKKYVERYRDESDRRRVFLVLTKQAHDVLKIHDQFHNDMINNVIKDLNIEKDEVLVKSLENLSRYFKNKY